MRLNVRVQPNAKQNKIVKEDGRYKVYPHTKNFGVRVYLTAPPVEGKANQALIEFLAEHFKVKRSQIKIVKGLKSRDKVVEIGQSN